MRQRGRPSADSLSVVAALVPSKRPPPPTELEPDAAEEWIAIADRMPADWFLRESHPLLANLCQLIVESRRVAGELAALRRESLRDDATLQRFDQLVRLQVRLSGAIATLSTKLRLTHQSRYGKRTAARQEERSCAKPWALDTGRRRISDATDDWNYG
jgi:hypothetical protein